MYKAWLVYPYKYNLPDELRDDDDEKPEFHLTDPGGWTSGEIKEIVFDFVKELNS